MNGQAFRVQGKVNVYSTIILTTSMQTLIETGQIEKLTLGYGTYINNYTSEILLKDILRQSFLSSILSGMQMHAPQDHALLRF